MRVRLIKKKSVEDFALAHASARIALRLWLSLLKVADWDRPADIRRTFPAADLLGNGSNRVVFDIGGNDYRIIAKYHFGQSQVHLFIKWIGTHAAYTKICTSGLQFEVDFY